jgi:DUF4097 and DUF4098 domain-containing protein YvlB
MKGKIWLFVSILCIALGLGLFLASGLRSGGDLLEVLDGAGYAERPTEKTYEVTERFHSVSVESTSDDVRILPSADGRCRVTCGETERYSYSVKVEKDVLTVVRKDSGKARYGFTFVSESIPVCVYLPEKSCKVLTVASTSGDVEARDLDFEQVRIDASSGEVELRAVSAKELQVSSTSGDLDLKELACSGGMTLHSTSGEIRLESCTLGSLALSCTSGDVELIRVDCAGEAKVETTSGEIKLQDVGAGSFDLSSTSGDVEGSVRGPVDFLVDTNSGDVRTRGGVRGAAPCRVNTTSGDVDLDAEG